MTWSQQHFKNWLVNKIIKTSFCQWADIFNFNASRFDKLVADWLVENMTLDVTPYKISLDVSINLQQTSKFN